MFILDQIEAAHSKVKSGADFPEYIKELKQFGVTSYETFVSDGHTDYFGTKGYKVIAPAKHELTIAETSKREQFKGALKLHQQGEMDFPTFVKMCAIFGVEKWQVCMDMMICAYFDKEGTEILVEQIPQ